MFKNIIAKFNASVEPVSTEEDFYFKTAGVTFDNRQEILKGIARRLRTETDPRSFYGGFTNRELKADRMSASELEYVYFDVDLIDGEFDGQPAYEIRFENELLGFVPRDKIAEFEALRKKYNYLKTEAYLTGGKTKRFDYDTEKVVLDVLTYGLIVHCHFFGVAKR